MLTQLASEAVSYSPLPPGEACPERSRRGQGEGRAFRFAPRWLLGCLVPLGLALLAFAEIEWLPKGMPREYAAHTSLALVPSPGADGPGSSRWTERLLESATHEDLLAAIIERLDLREETSGQPLAPAELRQQMRLNAPCIQVADGRGPATRGALVALTVRSPHDAGLDAIVTVWADLFVQRHASLAVQPVTPEFSFIPCAGG